jgi:glycosyltransferase involved in cell wall biosynthesis
MKVLYVSPYPPAQDGIGTYTQVLAGAVEAAGHQVAVVAARPEPGGPPEVIGALGTAGLGDAVARFGPDVIHVQFAVPAFGSLTPRLLRWLARQQTPVVTTMHEATRDTALLRGPGRALYRTVARHSDRLIVHTREAERTLSSRVGTPAGQVEVIPHFSAEPPAATTTAAQLRDRFGLGSDRLLLVFGFIHVDKGLDDLVRALTLLPARTLRNVRVVVAGTVRSRTGPFRLFELRDRLHLAKVRRMITRGGLSGRLVFTGYVPDGDIGAWFDAAEIVVLPYRKAEQSGVANLAQAFGVPVIATTAGGLAELFADAPWTVPPRAPDLLAEAIGRFINKTAYPEPPRHLGRTGLDAVVSATIAAYQTVHDRTGASSHGR